jgi:putative ABC transport system permease protein
MESFVRDLQYGFRTLARSRGFAFAALLTLALGIGANTAIFSVVNGVVLRPLPYGEPDRIAILWLNNTPEGIEEDITSFPTFSDWRERSTSFSHMAAIAGTNRNLTGSGDPEQVRAALVTADFFGVMASDAAVGRTLLPEENEPGREQVAVLSHGLFTRRFGGDASVVGSTIQLNGTPHTVVGVMPRGFAFPDDVELWLPLAPVAGLAQTMESRGSLWLQVLGRLGDDASIVGAQTEMTRISEALAEEYPQQQGYGVKVEPLHEDVVGDVRPALFVLFGAVAFVLLIACSNVANLLLARGAARQREVAVRLALGADRGRVVRQLLTESLVLSLAGGVIGLLLAWWAVGLLVAGAPADLPRVDAIGFDGRVVGFGVLASLITGLVFGAAPALQASRTELTTTLREGGRGATGAALLDRLRPVLVAAEVALALILLAGAGLLVRSFAALQGVDAGFETEDRLTFRVTLPGGERYAGEGAVERFFASLEDRLESTPGAESVAAVSNLFLSRLPNMAPITIEGQPPRGPDDARISVTMDAALGDLPSTLGIDVVRGRWFEPSDDDRVAPVAVVNETFVATFLAGEEAVGRRFVFGDPGENNEWITIVGIVQDTKRSGLAEPVRPEALFHHPQFTTNTLQFVVTARGDALALGPAVRAAVNDLDPEQPIAQLSTIDATIGEAVATRRFVMQLLALFSAVAVVLAAIGIYGVMAYLVSQRTRELGVRMAIGARPRNVLALVMRDAALYVAPGLLIGTIGALALSRFLRTQLYGVSATDPLTLIGVAVLFTLVALVASGVPAYRAARVDPMEALRYE